jgi:hypothetical protein
MSSTSGATLLPPQEGAHPVDDGARALVVLADVLDDRRDLGEVRRRIGHEERRRLGVAQDGAERLVDLVGERRCELAHHRDPADVGDVVAQAHRLPLLQLPRRDVDACTAATQRPPALVERDPADRLDPPGLPVGQRKTQLDVVLAAVATDLALATLEGGAVVAVDALQHGRRGSPARRA